MIIFYVLIFSTILLFFTANVKADDYHVKPLGNNTLGGTNWQTAWLTIGHAISNVTSGDVIIVSNGTYNESVIIANSTNISLISWSWLSSQDNTNVIVKYIGVDEKNNVLIEITLKKDDPFLQDVLNEIKERLHTFPNVGKIKISLV